MSYLMESLTLLNCLLGLQERRLGELDEDGQEQSQEEEEQSADQEDEQEEEI